MGENIFSLPLDKSRSECYTLNDGNPIQEDAIMATTTTPTLATSATLTPGAIEVKKPYKYFDLQEFQEQIEIVTVSFTPATSFAEAAQRVENNESKILAALNSYLQKAAFRQARREIAGKGASRKVVLDLIRPMRAMTPWNGMYELGPDGKPKVDPKTGEKIIDRPAQTKALLGLVRSTPALVESVRKTSVELAELESDEEEGGDEE